MARFLGPSYFSMDVAGDDRALLPLFVSYILDRWQEGIGGLAGGYVVFTEDPSVRRGFQNCERARRSGSTD